MKLTISTIFIIAITMLTQMDSNAQNNEKFNRYFQKKMDKPNLAGMQVAYISEGKSKWVNSYGYRDYDKKEQVNDSTLFMIASCSKPITALGVDLPPKLGR